MKNMNSHKGADAEYPSTLQAKYSVQMERESDSDANPHTCMWETGFTLIELLVVISIISLLSSAVLASLSGTREQAQITAAESELNSIRVGIQQLINDTGKWPNGCPPGDTNNPELHLDDPNAGLVSQPSIGLVDGGPCEWTSKDVNEWDGPYVQADQLTDPWGNNYWFDPDYWPYRANSCPKKQKSVRPAITSFGPTKNTWYRCDAIWVNLKTEST
jgi:prepilin-type N-terminal cleavage/methylation domain-containing protein